MMFSTEILNLIKEDEIEVENTNKKDGIDKKAEEIRKKLDKSTSGLSFLI